MSQARVWECIGYERRVSPSSPAAEAIALVVPGQGLMGTPVRAGRSSDGPRVRECIWPPLRPARLRLERGSVGVVLPIWFSPQIIGGRAIANDWT